MRIDLTQRFFNADDTVAEDAKTKEPLTLKHFLIQACLADFTGDRQPVPGDEKVKRYSIYAELKKAGNFAELSAEDIVLLKKAAYVFPTLVLGQLHSMLEGKPRLVKPAPETPA